MRIGIDITPFSHGNSGIQVYLRNILVHLERNTGDADVFLFERKRSGIHIANKKWKVFTIPLWKFPFSQTFWFHALLPLVVRILRIDVFWATDFFAPLFLPAKTKLFLTIYDITFIRFPETIDRKLLRQFRFYFSSSYKRANTVFTISDVVTKELESVFPKNKDKRIVVASCGKPSWNLPVEYDPKQRSDFLFTAGNFEPRKNHLSLFKALEILKDQGLSIPLRIAGQSGWNNEEMHKFLKERSIRENIFFLGYLTESELITMFCSCKALIFPSIYEGFGMPVLEALSLDCLVATSSNTVMQEICEKAALYFNPHRAESIASTIRQIYDPAFDRNFYLMHRQGVLKKFSWETSARIIDREFRRDPS